MTLPPVRNNLCEEELATNLPVTDKKPFLRAGVDEKVINFRPSPNFLNMKRFLKKKIVDTENVKGPPVCLSAEAIPKRECDSNMPIIKKKEDMVQPPLPQYPPPPDSPPLLDIVKQEIVDDSYETTDAELEAENASLQLEPVKQQADEEKPKMCKDFVRGECVRKQCKFSHVIDVTQLDGVFTFCWNYQNVGCNKPNCKYVHANPFEEGEFRRTGVLPPHALAHIKKRAVLPPPPPPPEPPQPPRAAAALPLFSHPPPPLCNSEKADGAEPLAVKPNLKREWSEVDDATSPNDELEDQSNCKFCVDMEFRLQYHKGNVEKMARSSSELDDKLRAADRQLRKLASVLATLLRPASARSPLSGLAPVLASDKDKNLMEQLSAMLDADGGL